MKKILIIVLIAMFINGCPEKRGDTYPPEAQQQKETTSVSSLQKSQLIHLGDSNSSQKALVIGNSRYAHQALSNPMNDAVDMANLLAEKGFHVIRATNLNYQDMDKVLSDFHQLLANTNSPIEKKVGVVYFSGHGARSNKNENYLIPTDNSRIRLAYHLRHQAFSIRKDIVEPMEKYNAGVNIMIADACRDNPYEGSSKSGKRGLTRESPDPAIDEKLGAVIAFAADEGEVADEGDERNGLYTKHLMNKMRAGGNKSIIDVFMEVQPPVVKESHDTQHPWYASTLAIDYCLDECQ